MDDAYPLPKLEAHRTQTLSTSVECTHPHTPPLSLFPPKHHFYFHDLDIGQGGQPPRWTAAKVDSLATSLTAQCHAESVCPKS